MLSCFDFVREFDMLSIPLRMLLALLCGALIGIEREFKRRPAGFRTHILICLGAAMTTLTSQYLAVFMGLQTDLARLGAQVIAGIGFIGAGSIIVTKRQRVKGLTTAAGLWCAAIIGLVCGAGYIECAVAATALVLLAELLLVKLEKRLARHARDMNIYIEYRHAAVIQSVVRLMRESRMVINSMEISRIANGEEHYYCAVLNVQLNRRQPEGSVSEKLSALEDVISVEEL